MATPPKLNGDPPTDPVHSRSGDVNVSEVATGKSGGSANPSSAGSPVKLDTKNALKPSGPAMKVSKTTTPTGIDVAVAAGGGASVKMNRSAVSVFHARMATVPFLERSARDRRTWLENSSATIPNRIAMRSTNARNI